MRSLGRLEHLADARDTSRASLGAAAALCAAKLVLMPLLYTAVARAVGCDAQPALLGFLGSLPASASVYPITVTKRLSPKVVGPLVPLSMLLSVALALLPLWPPADALDAASGLRVAIAVTGVAGIWLVANVPMPTEDKAD